MNSKYTVTKIISPHVVELDVPSKIWPRFHVDLLRSSSSDPLPSQNQDDLQPAPVLVSKDGENTVPEQIVEKILRAETVNRGGGQVRRLLVKWEGFAEPTWEDRSELEETQALDKFEQHYGIGDNFGEEEGARQGSKRSPKHRLQIYKDKKKNRVMK